MSRVCLGTEHGSLPEVLTAAKLWMCVFMHYREIQNVLFTFLMDSKTVNYDIHCKNEYALSNQKKNNVATYYKQYY